MQAAAPLPPPRAPPLFLLTSCLRPPFPSPPLPRLPPEECGYLRGWAYERDAPELVKDFEVPRPMLVVKGQSLWSKELVKDDGHAPERVKDVRRSGPEHRPWRSGQRSK